MRVVGGRARGVTLTVVRAPGLRPTTDRVRGAIFSMLEARQAVTEARGLDLYAGTGALGIEALSRGASWVDFVERSPRLSAALRTNLARTSFLERARVLTMPVLRAVGTLEQRYDLVFLDPPYDETEAVELVIQGLLSAGRVQPDAMIVVEQGSRDERDFSQPGLQEIQRKRYGDTVVSLYQVAEGASA